MKDSWKEIYLKGQIWKFLVFEEFQNEMKMKFLTYRVTS